MRSKGVIGLVAVLAIGLLLVMGGCGAYNSLVQADEEVKEAWANVETNYQRRADLIPNLVNTVRAAADFEQETLDAVVSARSRATQINVTAEDLDNPEVMARFQAAQGELSGALSRLFAVTENYPDLQAVDAFRDLQVQLEGTENRINTARTRFNGAVRTYNTQVRRFPTAMFAGVMGFSARQAFEADPGAEQAPTVDFS